MRKAPDFRAFSDEELVFMQTFKVGELSVQAGSTILHEGHNSAHLFTVLEGAAFRFKMFEDGARQVLNFAFPGDLIGLQAALFDKMEHSVEALTGMRLCVFERERVWELFRLHPDLGFDLTWLAAREESMLSAHLASVGQRNAFERLSYVIAFLFDRARRRGLTRDTRLLVPITQEHLADAMGLSMVHTNKTLKRIRQAGLIAWGRNELAVLDEAALRAHAGLDPVRARRWPIL